MKYKLVERRNPTKPDDAKKWYASAVKAGTIDINRLAKEISTKSSLSRGEVLNIIETLLDAVPDYLKDGYTVSLGRFGSIRLTLSSEGIENRDNFNTSLIKGGHLILTPSVPLKTELQNIPLERVE